MYLNISEMGKGVFGIDAAATILFQQTCEKSEPQRSRR